MARHKRLGDYFITPSYYVNTVGLAIVRALPDRGALVKRPTSKRWRTIKVEMSEPHDPDAADRLIDRLKMLHISKFALQKAPLDCVGRATIASSVIHRVCVAYVESYQKRGIRRHLRVVGREA